MYVRIQWLYTEAMDQPTVLHVQYIHVHVVTCVVVAVHAYTYHMYSMCMLSTLCITVCV